MTSVVVRPPRGFRYAVLLGALSPLVACGGEQPAPSGSGGVHSGAGMSAGGTAGVSVTGGSAGTSSPMGGAGGAGASGAGTGANGGAGAAGSGGTNDGTAGMTGGSAGMAGAAPMGGGGAGGAISTGGSGGSGGSEALSFRADIYPVFQMIRNPAFVYPGAGSFDSCNDTGVCHGGEVAPGAGLGMMDVDMAYGELVGVMSESELCDGTIRVAAGNPEQSCLIRFYEGRLRDELDWVDNPEIDLMRRWIAQGALP